MRHGSRVPVIASFMAGWAFPFVKAHHLAIHLALPVGLLVLLQFFGLTPQGVIYSDTSSDLAVTGVFLLHLCITSLVIAGAYRVAAGGEHRFFMARLELGPDEIRVIGAKLVVWIAAFTLLLGSRTLSGQLLAVLQTVGLVTSSGAQIPPGEFQWWKDIEVLAPFLEFFPLVLFSVLATWFGLRFSLVFAGIVAERHFGIFTHMALTKGATWRLAFLWILLWFSLIAAIKGPLIVFGFMPFEVQWIKEFDLSKLLTVLATFDWGPPLQFAAGSAAEAANETAAPVFNPSKKSNPSMPVPWLGPIVTVAGNVLWQIVFAGAFTHVYKNLNLARARHFR